ncbi:hypothetical protein [Polyangium jinanense]|uniref:Uncharacterized protein n=1 Tax=Polyangium jinanense TaxID=2829994 RepID=A0A9X3XGX1_9BACT|nr:hypothetical protein [Polyangium jinanense]MDC3962403.1 hypothetical protein [Polyangium jinanense]MDC3989295.1 hypothetical protein [Polyangium jinanense]
MSNSENLVLASDRGRVWLRFPAPGVLVMRVEGYGEESFVEPIISQFERMLATCSCPMIFIDAEHLGEFDRKYRVEMTHLIVDNHRRFGGVTVLVRSKLVAAGASLLKLGRGGILRPLATRAEFEAALHEGIQKAMTTRVDGERLSERPRDERYA